MIVNISPILDDQGDLKQHTRHYQRHSQDTDKLEEKFHYATPFHNIPRSFAAMLEFRCPDSFHPNRSLFSGVSARYVCLDQNSVGYKVIDGPGNSHNETVKSRQQMFHLRPHHQPSEL